MMEDSAAAVCSCMLGVPCQWLSDPAWLQLAWHHQHRVEEVLTARKWLPLFAVWHTGSCIHFHTVRHRLGIIWRPCCGFWVMHGEQCSGAAGAWILHMCYQLSGCKQCPRVWDSLSYGLVSLSMAPKEHPLLFGWKM